MAFVTAFERRERKNPTKRVAPPNEKWMKRKVKKIHTGKMKEAQLKMGKERQHTFKCDGGINAITHLPVPSVHTDTLSHCAAELIAIII